MKSTNESSSRPSLATLILAVVAVLLVTAAIAVALLPDRDLPAWLLSVLGRQPGLSVCDVKIGNTLFELEIANLKATREQGLKARDSMPADHGMIFVFKDPQLLCPALKQRFQTRHLALQFVVLAAKINKASARDSYCSRRPGFTRL